jgi:hypothetical protein
MRTNLKTIPDQDLVYISGGQFSVQNHGWRGGSVTTQEGSSVVVTPFYSRFSLTNDASNRFASGLNVAAAATALGCAPVSAAAGIAGSLVSFMNKGNGVNITIPHPIPGAVITPRR